MAQVTIEDFDWITLLEKIAVESIEAQNWTDMPLTQREKLLISMAVSWTYGTLKDMAETKERRA